MYRIAWLDKYGKAYRSIPDIKSIKEGINRGKILIGKKHFWLEWVD